MPKTGGSLLILVIFGACVGSPVQLREEDEGAVVVTDCIPTPWGCIDPSDPSIRPLAINVEQLLESSDAANGEKIAPRRGCIPTKWGCIDPSDASIHPRTMVGKEQRKRCPCINTPYGCIDPCDPGIHPVANSTDGLH